MVGVIPTRTSIELRAADGTIATIPPADARAAGCMTAQQAALLDAIEQWRQRGAEGASFAAALPDMSGFALRADMMRVVERVARIEASKAAVPQTIAPSLIMDAEAGDVARAAGTAAIQAAEEVIALAVKNAALERRIEHLEETLLGLTTIIDQIAGQRGHVAA